MTTQPDARPGDTSLDGGVTDGTLPEQASALAVLVDALVAAQRGRDERLADLLAEAEGTCDYRRLDEATADCNAAASNELDQLLSVLRLAGIGAPPPRPPTNDGDSSRAAWADAGYTSPAAVAEWMAVGIDTPVVAQQWVDAGFTAESASLWVEVADMTPSEAASCATVGMTPVDVERIRRVDPGWVRPDSPSEAPAPAPDWGITA